MNSFSPLIARLRLKLAGLFGSIACLGLASSPVFAADITRVEYSCDEGIPMIVEFLNTSQTSIATVSHDSGPKVVLEQIVSGSGSQYSNGEWTLSAKGDTAHLSWGDGGHTCTRVGAHANKPHHQNQDVSLPRKAKSWGGIMRSGPGTNYRKMSSLREGEWIMILERTDRFMGDYPWFKIKARGRIGYKWGGILCSVGPQIQGTFQQCK
ncbi:MAG: hypothetical protein DHS20C08_14450 [Rhodomicrobium sp.]|nr:MAG: hypothetical protein DHS20C08_14450 [Rhodomicrobium sp.]